MHKSRTKRAAALERWAETVEAANLVPVESRALLHIAELVEQREQIDTELTDAVRSAREANRSWSEIGAMLGVSKQAAQQKYSAKG